MTPESLTLPMLQGTVAELRQLVGPRLVAYCCDGSNKQTVHRWISGDEIPDEDQIAQLWVMAEVFDIVLRHESAETARVWFVGLSIGEGDAAISPAEAIRVCNFDEVRASARQFAADGGF